ncbi:MAG: ribosome small subunit-dependent GTPase A [Marinilabiliaceae bacterium]|nr:ribosome small subunit-dependent GTPase A [Marinilabiliaceae bacterium]
MEGIVIKSTGSWYVVQLVDGTLKNCRIKGKMRIEDIKSTNPVAVGDFVSVQDEDEQDSGVITSIKERKNYIVRRSTNLSKQSHIIAANIDQAILVITLNYPVTTRVFIDRFLASAEAYRIPVVLVFNKIDRFDRRHLIELDELKSIYENIGYKTLLVSAKKQEDISDFRDLLKDKKSVIAGHSGVGKSTLVNRIEPGLNLKTAEISASHHSGKHTTTFAEMHRLSMGGYIIDTPGIRGFGLYDIEKTELHHFFIEIFTASANCQYNNCTHVHEPGCAVKEAVDNKIIAKSRYDSYLSILLNKDEKYR